MASPGIAECSKLIAKNNFKIAFAESATAGWLASEFSLTEQSGSILLGGVICYDAFTKEQLFGISKKTIQRYTAESAEVTKALADALPKLFNCDIAVAITGLTTPGGSETPDKPVGTMFIHINMPDNRYVVHREVFEGDAEHIIKGTIECVGRLITEMLEKYEE